MNFKQLLPHKLKILSLLLITPSSIPAFACNGNLAGASLLAPLLAPIVAAGCFWLYRRKYKASKIKATLFSFIVLIGVFYLSLPLFMQHFAKCSALAPLSEPGLHNE